jgi:hypothetical protein
MRAAIWRRCDPFPIGHSTREGTTRAGSRRILNPPFHQTSGLKGYLLWRDAGRYVLRNQERAWLDRLDRDGSAGRRSNKHIHRTIRACLPGLSLPPSGKLFGLVSESVPS